MDENENTNLILVEVVAVVIVFNILHEADVCNSFLFPNDRGGRFFVKPNLPPPRWNKEKLVSTIKVRISSKITTQIQNSIRWYEEGKQCQATSSWYQGLHFTKQCSACIWRKFYFFFSQPLLIEVNPMRLRNCYTFTNLDSNPNEDLDYRPYQFKISTLHLYPFFNSYKCREKHIAYYYASNLCPE